MSVFVHRNGEQLGPFEPEEIAAKVVRGELSREDLGWNEDDQKWEPLGDLFFGEIDEAQSAEQDRLDAEEERRETFADFRSNLSEAWREAYEEGDVLEEKLTREQRRLILAHAEKTGIEISDLLPMLSTHFPELLVPGFAARLAEREREQRYLHSVGEFAPIVRIDRMPPREKGERRITDKQRAFLQRLGLRDEATLESLGKGQARAVINAILIAKGEKSHNDLGARVRLQESPATIAYKQKRAPKTPKVVAVPEMTRAALSNAARVHAQAVRSQTPPDAPIVRIVRKSSTFGAGCLVQFIGILIGLFLGFPFGLIVFVILLVIGSSMAVSFHCERCGTKLADRKVFICPACHSAFSK